MSIHKRTAVVVVARQLRQYNQGERVKVLRGKYANKIMTVRRSTNNYVVLVEGLQRDLISKHLIEPEFGFTDEELVQAGRVAEKIQKGE